MANAQAITAALNRLRADRPGLGLEDSIEAHWIDWFARTEFRDEDVVSAVHLYIERTPSRTWPTVAEIERALQEVERLNNELESEPCFWNCKQGLVYKAVERPYRRTVMVPCECPKGLSKLASFREKPAGNKFRLNSEGEEIRLEEPGS